MLLPRYDPKEDRVVLPTNTGKPFHILSVCLEPTNRCKGKCPYCLIENHKKDAAYSDLIEYLHILRQHGVARVGWGGGEPLVRDDIYQLGLAAREMEMGSLLRTSGMYLLDNTRVTDSFDWVDISFDSSDEEIFQKVRPGVPYPIVLQNVKALIENDVKVRISILITKHNVGTVDTTIRYLANLGIRHIRLQRLVPRGDAVTNWSQLSVSSAIVDEQINQSMMLGKTLKIDVKELKSVSSTTLAILKTDGTLCIGDPNGQVAIGNIREHGVFESAAEAIAPAQLTAYGNGYESQNEAK